MEVKSHYFRAHVSCILSVKRNVLPSLDTLVNHLQHPSHRISKFPWKYNTNECIFAENLGMDRLSLTLNGGEWLLSRPDSFSAGRAPRTLRLGLPL
jgi:hypothetical protein